jgi:hypothetical protein
MSLEDLVVVSLMLMGSLRLLPLLLLLLLLPVPTVCNLWHQTTAPMGSQQAPVLPVLHRQQRLKRIAVLSRRQLGHPKVPMEGVVVREVALDGLHAHRTPAAAPPSKS